MILPVVYCRDKLRRLELRMFLIRNISEYCIYGSPKLEYTKKIKFKFSFSQTNAVREHLS